MTLAEARILANALRDLVRRGVKVSVVGTEERALSGRSDPPYHIEVRNEREGVLIYVQKADTFFASTFSALTRK